MNSTYDKPKFNYDWTLKDAIFTRDKGKVFSCFAGGGGSSLGYKLAGYDVIGCNEIDPAQMLSYLVNNHPKYWFLEPIQDLINREDLPHELYDLDILDGSFPCTTFSMIGHREKSWGIEKSFTEGGVKQRLDDLAFYFIKLARKLQPKIVIGENVTGLAFGDAKKYLKSILHELDNAGYFPQFHVVKGQEIGLPQMRERIFIIGLRKDLIGLVSNNKQSSRFINNTPMLNLNSNCEPIPYKHVEDLSKEAMQHNVNMTNTQKEEWTMCVVKGYLSSSDYLGKNFARRIIYPDNMVNTITAEGLSEDSPTQKFNYRFCRTLNNKELLKVCSFPSDYDFCEMPGYYTMGMSVPPIMMANVSLRIHEQWLSKIAGCKQQPNINKVQK